MALTRERKNDPEQELLSAETNSCRFYFTHFYEITPRFQNVITSFIVRISSLIVGVCNCDLFRNFKGLMVGDFRFLGRTRTQCLKARIVGSSCFYPEHAV